jgi:hypothetical protein
MAAGLQQERMKLSLEELASARRATEKVSALLEQKLLGFMEVLRPILLPAYLGRSASVRPENLGGDKVVSELKDRYRGFVEKRLELPRDFEPSWLDELGTKLEFRRWEYVYGLEGSAQKQPIQVTSPGRWLVSYGPGLSLAQATRVFSHREEKNLVPLRQFLINSLMLASVVKRNAGLASLLRALRYRLEVFEYPALHNVPLVLISAEIPSLLPTDDVIRVATALSGVPAFIEVLDLKSLETLRDPYKEDIEQALRD